MDSSRNGSTLYRRRFGTTRIIGLPPKTGNTVLELVKKGQILLDHLGKGGEVDGKSSPQSAIPLLLAIAENVQGKNGENFLKDLGTDFQYAEFPRIVSDSVPNSAWDRFRKRSPYPNVEKFLKEYGNPSDRIEGSVQSWKSVRDMWPDGVEGSQKTYRYVFRLIKRIWGTKANLIARDALRSELFSPLPTGDYQVRQFVFRCWAMRASSISCHLPKLPPESVKFLLESFLGDEKRIEPSSFRSAILRRLKKFVEWTEMMPFYNGGNPTLWADTLSNFAKALNPIIMRYNKIVREEDQLCPVTSFVPFDLAGEMYSAALRDQNYFFGPQGYYYSYSPQWRAAAFRRLRLGTIPENWKDLIPIAKKISPDVVERGCDELKVALETDDNRAKVIKYLNWYYFSGAFLDVVRG